MQRTMPRWLVRLFYFPALVWKQNQLVLVKDGHTERSGDNYEQYPAAYVQARHTAMFSS